MHPRIEPTLDRGNGPPPLPPATPRPPPMQPRRGMHGCLIALIVCAGLAIPLVGILAAIAIPQYQHYVLRSKVAAAAARAESLKPEVDAAYARDGSCGEHDETEQRGEFRFGQDRDPEVFGSSISIDRLADGRCGIALTLSGPAGVDGKQVHWRRTAAADGAHWSCDSDLDPKYRPTACRAR